MSLASRVVSILLEADFDEEEMLQQLAQVARDATVKKLAPGDEIARATGRSEDIAQATIDMIEQLHRPSASALRSNYSDEFEALQRVRDGSRDPDDYATVDDLAYEKLDHAIQRFCLPFTYVGSNEGDGSYGCWVSHEGLDEAAEEGTVTKFLTSDPRTKQFEEGQLPVDTEYVWIHNDDDYGDTLYDARSRRLLWSY